MFALPPRTIRESIFKVLFGKGIEAYHFKRTPQNLPDAYQAVSQLLVQCGYEPYETQKIPGGLQLSEFGQDYLVCIAVTISIKFKVAVWMKLKEDGKPVRLGEFKVFQNPMERFMMAAAIYRAYDAGFLRMKEAFDSSPEAKDLDSADYGRLLEKLAGDMSHDFGSRLTDAKRRADHPDQNHEKLVNYTPEELRSFAEDQISKRPVKTDDSSTPSPDAIKPSSGKGVGSRKRKRAAR